jgi:hypothetical protein
VEVVPPRHQRKSWVIPISVGDLYFDAGSFFSDTELMQ